MRLGRRCGSIYLFAEGLPYSCYPIESPSKTYILILVITLAN